MENFSKFPKTANLNYTYWRLYLIVWPKKLVANIKDEYSNTSNKPQINSTSEELEAIVSRFALSFVFLEERNLTKLAYIFNLTLLQRKNEFKEFMRSSFLGVNAR